MAREGIRKKAEAILDPVTKQVPIYSDKPKNGVDLYARYTDLSQKHLEKNWDTVQKNGKKGQMTGCNSFVGWYSRQLGTVYLGGIDIEADLRKAGMQHAWVRSSSGGKPRYGDMCQHAEVTHTSISLDMEGGTWPRLNAGQGGSGMRKDVIAISKGVWASGVLKGWVDIDSLAKATAPVPDWLLGWWQVAFRGDTYYYYFDLTHQVKWSEFRPRDTMMRMMATDGGAGSFAVKDGSEITIKWRSGNVEKFTRSSSGDRIAGTWNESAAISAERM